MDIHLKPHCEQFIKEQLAKGGFRSPEDLVERAIEVFAERVYRSAAPPKTPAEAVTDILELRKGVTLGGLKIKDLIHEGHRI